MLTRRIRKLLRGLTVRLAAGSVRFRPHNYFNRRKRGRGMAKQKEYSRRQIVFGAFSIGIILALVVQVFFRIIS